MPTPSKGASAPSEYREFVVKRDGNRPISFAGRALAEVSMTGGLSWSVRAALYETRGGKFVSALFKEDHLIPLTGAFGDPETAHSGEFNKARVFDSFEEAFAWFRPGRLTDALRKQLGLNEPERIE